MSGENALTFSAHYRNGFAVRYLIENQHYDVNSYDSDGNTALIVATKNEQQAIVEILIELGADASIRDANEKTALDYAVENNYDAIISILNDID